MLGLTELVEIKLIMDIQKKWKTLTLAFTIKKNRSFDGAAYTYHNQRKSYPRSFCFRENVRSELKPFLRQRLFTFLTFIVAIYLTKFKLFIFEHVPTVYRWTFEPADKECKHFKPQKAIRNMGEGRGKNLSRIRILGPKKHRIPDPQRWANH